MLQIELLILDYEKISTLKDRYESKLVILFISIRIDYKYWNDLSLYETISIHVYKT